MLQPTLVSDKEELQQILLLQQENLLTNVSEEERKAQGFVTMHHDLTILEQMHRLSPSVIIKDNDKVVAYALTMLRESRQLMPGLKAMFNLLDDLHWEGNLLSDHRFYVMGQICVAKEYRGKDLVNELYQHHKKVYQSQFDLFITEISTRNHRSIRVHEKVGFKTIHTHRDHLDEWVIVGWDWE
jgi:ribosomal protein S18 acetylase RimI-like enzyme